MKVCVLQVFFLFSSTKIGHDRPSVKDRYAISDKNILRSCVVRYFYLKFLACRSSMPWEMYKKKGKKWGGRCVEAVMRLKAVSSRMKHLMALCPNCSSLSVRIRYQLFYCTRLELYCDRFPFDNRDFQCVFNFGQSFE